MITSPPTPAALSATYTASPHAYDEAFDGTQPRETWRELIQKLDEIGAEELTRRTLQAARLLDENGVTYGASTESQPRQRPWTLDLVPLVMEDDEWRRISSGIAQRARLFDALVKDLYGPQRSLREGQLPAAAVFGHPGFLHPAFGMHSPGESVPAPGNRSLVLYAAELARSNDGRLWVMADRSDAPAGTGFSLENRIVTKRVLPSVAQSMHVRQLAPFFVEMQRTLRKLSPRAVEHPRIVLLTPGPTNANYFEDVYLARYLGYDLAQGSDLAVRDDHVFLKTLAGLLPVHVIVSRGSEAGLDPVELGGGSGHGVPGLLQAVRAGHVAVANTPGTGLVESPVFMASLPRLCEQLLGETLQIPSIATWWCHHAEAREYVFENISRLVIKPAFAASGGDEFIGADLNAAEIEKLRKQIAAKPYAFVAQELVTRSAAPTLSQTTSSQTGSLVPGYVAIRMFAVASGDNYTVMPGGLVRVSESTGPMVLSISGGERSKDLWVRTRSAVEAVSLLPMPQRKLPLKRTSAMFPSRVAYDLFWLGQSIDRADFLARLFRALLVRLTSELDSNTPDTDSLLRAMIELGLLEPDFAVGELAATLPRLTDALPQILGDTKESRGLGSAVAELLRLSSLVRDWLSPETWQQLRRSASEFLNSEAALPRDLTSIAGDLDHLILALASATGLIDNGMIRSPAWRFLDFGRRIERARSSCGFLRATLTHPQLQDSLSLRMIVEVFDCQMTYRARYLDDIQQNAVIDLCLTDATNPRSVEYQMGILAVHVDALPGQDTALLWNREKRLVMSAAQALRMLTVEDLATAEPIELQNALETVEAKLQQLADLLERKYLLHSGEPRQIINEVGVVS